MEAQVPSTFKYNRTQITNYTNSTLKVLGGKSEDDDENDEDTCIIPDIAGLNKCEFVRENCSDFGSEALLPYLDWYHCSFNRIPTLYFFIIITVLIYTFILLGSTADQYFVPALIHLSDTIKLSEEMAGITLLSFGNGAPDLFSQIAGAASGSLSISLGEAMGSGLLTITVLVAVITFIQPFKMEIKLLFKDAPAYLLGVALVFISLLIKKMPLWLAILFLGVYVCYIALSFLLEKIQNKLEERNKAKEEEAAWREGNLEAPLVGRVPVISESHEHLTTQADTGLGQDSLLKSINEGLSPEEKGQIEPQVFIQYCLKCLREWTDWEERGTVTRIIAILEFPFTVLRVATHPTIEYNNPVRLTICCICSPITIAFLSQYTANPVGDAGMMAWHLCLIVGVAVIPLFLFLNSHSVRKRLPWIAFVFSLWRMALSVIWMNALAQELVTVITSFGSIVQLSSGILSATVMSWGNALGDFVANIAVARVGRPITAVSACYAGPLFNLLVGLSLSSFWVFIKNGDVTPIPIPMKLQRMICVVLLIGTLLFTLFIGVIRKLKSERWFGVVLCGIYVAFTALIILAEFDILKIL